MRPVFFLSDFGLQDPYVGVVKAVLAQKAPGIGVVDLAHDLPPQDLRRAAYALFEAVPYLPEGSVILAVVDPGVGTARRAVAALGRRAYVGPDNGLFTLAWLLDPPRRAYALDRVKPPRPQSLDPLPGWRPGAFTFHGRDRFAPAAAHLALGLPPEALGEEVPVESLLRLPLALTPGPEGEILTFDRFGNAITTLLQAPLGGWVEVAGRRVPIRRTFGEVEVGEGVAYLGSAGLLEIALNRGSAREAWGLEEGMPVRLTGP
ncbi:MULTISPECIES: SAM hydrolase/SAM-dependent halogenase family protein [Thermus]|jgi:S-adenosylmethionine hydrolase|uniref:Adenosyl-chloride synthase n=1 Tax=Thermus brockianus TaxID=56956 RepID=A0A1J0LT43_THEBO|nr:SAM-dependent chlorinase/fluorinase [Thermus brockianus]APD09266.1 Adenosyl-chloride synthase [Thermus brockianus]